MNAPTLSRSAPRRCSGCAIRERAVCAHCDDAELARLESMKSYRTWRAGETIVAEGEALEFAASVVEGAATLSRTLQDGRTQIVGLLLPSDFIGRPGRRTAAYAVEAASDVTLCMFRRAPFEAMLRDSPHVATRLLEMSLDELDATRDWMVLLGRKTAREKVATFLLSLLRRGAAADDAGIDLPLTREAMATFLGLTIETVSRQMTALRKAGIVETEGQRRVRCADLDALALVAGEDGDGGLLP